jgi:ADP-ribose pyrophosphatase YjhB (NUDIX family)
MVATLQRRLHGDSPDLAIRPLNLQARAMARDTFCSHCGARFGDTMGYPRTCGGCGVQIWANPVPVAVVLLPVIDGGRRGLLVVRRAIPPVGKIALVGGFIEDDETWQACAARELREEAQVVIDPAQLEPWWYASSAPRPDRLLVFALAPAVEASALPSFAPNAEATERGIFFGAGGGAHDDADDELGFPLHAEAARRYFAQFGAGGGGFVAR